MLQPRRGGRDSASTCLTQRRGHGYVDSRERSQRRRAGCCDDRRYALDCGKLRALGWRSRHSFDQALEQTVRWFVDNEAWWRPIKSGAYKEYYRKQYEERG